MASLAGTTKSIDFLESRSGANRRRFAIIPARETPTESSDAVGDGSRVHRLERGHLEVPDETRGQQFSGHVAVVRALVHEPKIVFADEPTAALDQENGRRVVDALAGWRSRGAVVIVTHDAGMLQGADGVVFLRDGRRLADSDDRE